MVSLIHSAFALRGKILMNLFFIEAFRHCLRRIFCIYKQHNVLVGLGERVTSENTIEIYFVVNLKNRVFRYFSISFMCQFAFQVKISYKKLFAEIVDRKETGACQRKKQKIKWREKLNKNKKL